jgi:hypothetical protein
VPRLRRTAVVFATAICMGAALTAAMTAPASARSVLTPAQAAARPASTNQDCYDGNGIGQAGQFYRCTGTSPSSQWVGSSCAAGNYNAGTQFNVYIAFNTCDTRVWLHEYPYPEWESSGWTVCATIGVSDDIDPQYQHPENIYVSTNYSQC